MVWGGEIWCLSWPSALSLVMVFFTESSNVIIISLWSQQAINESLPDFRNENWFLQFGDSLCSLHPPWNLNTQKPLPKSRWCCEGIGNGSHKYQQEANTNKQWVQKGSVRSVVLRTNLQRERNVTRVEGAWENTSALFFFSWELFCSMFPDNLQRSYLL